MQIRTKRESNGPITFVTFAVLFFLPYCCVKSLIPHPWEQRTGLVKGVAELGGMVTGQIEQPTFHDATTGSSAKWRLRNECRNSILMMRQYPQLGTDTSSVWNFCTHFSDAISQGNQWWCPEISAVFSGYNKLVHNVESFYTSHQRPCFNTSCNK